MGGSQLVFELIDSPVGELLLLGDGELLCGLMFDGSRAAEAVSSRARRYGGAYDDARAQLTEYFAGARRAFELRLEPPGTAFQRLAWDALREIPYGTTRTYAEQAATLGRPGAARAVGSANARNPIPIIVPCHRLVGRDGGLTGFGGGLQRKRYLLELEASVNRRARSPRSS